MRADPPLSLASVLGSALRMTVVTFVLTGLLYPLAVTALAQVLFHQRANGSWATDEQGRVVGSELLGQNFTHPGYFHLRPSAAGELGYDAAASSGSNLGPASAKLRARVGAEVERLKIENPDAEFPVPSELVTTSASGLDPHLSPEGALWQVARVAKARNVPLDRVKTLVVAQSEGRDFGFLGEARVNVLALNLALDKKFGRPLEELHR